jgi:hypothetical protein
MTTRFGFGTTTQTVMTLGWISVALTLLLTAPALALALAG